MSAETSTTGVPPCLLEPEIEKITNQYIREMARYEKAAATVAERLRRELRAEARLRHLISFRAKHPEDLREKLRRKRDDSRYAFDQLRNDLNSIVTDLAGCRVVVYIPDDEHRVIALIDRVFRFPVRSDAQPKPYHKESGYRATHRLVLASENVEDISIQGALCEIQVTTLAAHLFNELEHDVTYKDHGQRPSEEERRILEEILWATKLSDRASGRLPAAHNQTTRDNDILEDAEALRFALEREVQRPLAGDFVRLHRMLEGTLNQLSISILRNLGDIRETILQGKTFAEGLSLEDPLDDVVCYALGLRKLRDELALQAQSWRGPETPLKRALMHAMHGNIDNPSAAVHDTKGSPDMEKV